MGIFRYAPPLLRSPSTVFHSPFNECVRSQIGFLCLETGFLLLRLFLPLFQWCHLCDLTRNCRPPPFLRPFTGWTMFCPKQPCLPSSLSFSFIIIILSPLPSLPLFQRSNSQCLPTALSGTERERERERDGPSLGLLLRGRKEGKDRGGDDRRRRRCRRPEYQKQRLRLSYSPREPVLVFSHPNHAIVLLSFFSSSKSQRCHRRDDLIKLNG